LDVGMNGFLRNFFLRAGRGGLLALLCFGFVLPSMASELKVEARLIWGTNDEKVSDPKVKPVDKATAEKFSKIFQWKHYFEVNRETATVPSRQNKKITLSPKCSIDIKELEGPKVEVTLFGEEKAVNKTTYPLSKGESFTIAGDCKDGNAWFILITELDEKN
jgi:hypothetical protein